MLKQTSINIFVGFLCCQINGQTYVSLSKLVLALSELGLSHPESFLTSEPECLVPLSVAVNHQDLSDFTGPRKLCRSLKAVSLPNIYPVPFDSHFHFDYNQLILLSTLLMEIINTKAEIRLRGNCPFTVSNMSGSLLLNVLEE